MGCIQQGGGKVTIATYCMVCGHYKLCINDGNHNPICPECKSEKLKEKSIVSVNNKDIHISTNTTNLIKRGDLIFLSGSGIDVKLKYNERDIDMLLEAGNIIVFKLKDDIQLEV